MVWGQGLHISWIVGELGNGSPVHDHLDLAHQGVNPIVVQDLFLDYRLDHLTRSSDAPLPYTTMMGTSWWIKQPLRISLQEEVVDL